MATFYVPKGQKKVVVFLPHGDFNGAFKFAVFDGSGKPAKLHPRDNSRVLEADVPPDQDGRVWALDRVVSPDEPIELLTTPQLLALMPQGALAPADAR